MRHRTNTSGRRIPPANALGLEFAYLTVVIAGALEPGASTAHAGDDAGMVITIIRTLVLKRRSPRTPRSTLD